MCVSHYFTTMVPGRVEHDVGRRRSWVTKPASKKNQLLENQKNTYKGNSPFSSCEMAVMP